jgi:hypothetical protein
MHLVTSTGAGFGSFPQRVDLRVGDFGHLGRGELAVGDGVVDYAVSPKPSRVEVRLVSRAGPRRATRAPSLSDSHDDSVPTPAIRLHCSAASTRSM